MTNALGSPSGLTFEDWWERVGQPYKAAVIETGGTPWTRGERKLAALRRAGLPISDDTTETRRALWNRPYRPINTEPEARQPISEQEIAA